MHVRRWSAGFSLLELLVVLFIIGLMTAVAIPMLGGGMAGTELRSAARDIAAGLRAARNHAVTGQREATLALDLERRIATADGATRSIEIPASLDIRLYTARRELVDESRGSIRFFPDGSSTGGHVRLARGGQGLNVNVDWLTGRVYIEDAEVTP